MGMWGLCAERKRPRLEVEKVNVCKPKPLSPPLVFPPAACELPLGESLNLSQ
jgi:hypothetical protein